MIRAVDRFVNRFVELFGIIAGFMMCAMIFTTFLESAARYLGHPTIWAPEFTEYSLVYLVFFGISYAEKYNDHIRVDFFIDLLPGRVKRWFEVFNYVCVVALAVLLTYYGAKLTIKSYLASVVSPTPLRVPLFFVQAMLPIGMAAMSVKTIFKLIFLIKEG